VRHDKRNETYFWIKLRQDLMHSKEIKLLMRQVDGGWYFSIFVYLIMLSINSEGRLIQKVNKMEMIYDLETITQELMFFKIDTVRVAIQMLKSLGLLYENKSKVLCIANFERLVGSETGWAEAKRKQRNKDINIGGEIVPINVHPESRDKSQELRIKKSDIRMNDQKDTYDNNDNIVFLENDSIEKKFYEFTASEWELEFGKSHAFTKYLVYSKYIIKGDLDLLLSANSLFESLLEKSYEFDYLKQHVQYFLYQYRKMKKTDQENIKNRIGYLSRAIRKNQESLELRSCNSI